MQLQNLDKEINDIWCSSWFKDYKDVKDIRIDEV